MPFLISVGNGSSRRTSSGSLSSRTPRKVGKRRRPSCVHSTNSISTTSSGSTHLTSLFRTRGIFGSVTSGESGRSSGFRRASSSSISSSVNPVPTLPAQRRPLCSWTASTSAPMRSRLRCPFVYPATTSSCRGRTFTFSQLAGAPLLVQRVRALGHDALEALLGGRLEQRVPVVEHVRDVHRRSSARGASSVGGGAPSAAGRRAARRPARARRTRSRRASPSPCCIAEKLARPVSSTAQTSPSSTQSGVRTARGSALRDRRRSVL